MENLYTCCLKHYPVEILCSLSEEHANIKKIGWGYNYITNTINDEEEILKKYYKLIAYSQNFQIVFTQEGDGWRTEMLLLNGEPPFNTCSECKQIKNVKDLENKFKYYVQTRTGGREYLLIFGKKYAITLDNKNQILFEFISECKPYKKE